MYRWQQVKVLHAQGMGIKRIARRLKLSKNTVKKYLKSADPPVFHARGYTRKIDSYGNDIARMLGKGFIGTRIHEELIALGFTGSLSTVERAIKVAKTEKERTGRITTRVETGPGEQLQYDWKEWKLPVAGRTVLIHIHEAILAFSREKYYTFSLTIKEADVIRAIHEALTCFGGVPAHLVMDNAKQMVITHERDGAILYNESFLKFMGLVGMEVNPCQNYRARTKGKVENPFFHLQEHLLRGLEVADLNEFAQKLEAYTEKVNHRVHGTTREIPAERFERERPHLRPLPALDPRLLYPTEPRGVNHEGYLFWDGSAYPVPMALALKPVRVEPVFGRMIRVFDEGGREAATIELSLAPGVRPPHPEHEEMNRRYREHKEAKKSAIVQAFADTFPQHAAYMEALKNAQGPNLYAHLKAIVSYTDLYPAEEVGKTLSECLALGAFHKNTVKRLLGTRPPVPPALTAGAFTGPAQITRDLSVYGEVIHD